MPDEQAKDTQRSAIADELGVDPAAVELTFVQGADGVTVTAKVTVTDPNPNPNTIPNTP